MFHCLICLKELDIVNVERHSLEGDMTEIVVDLECKTCDILALKVCLADIPKFQYLLDR